MILLANSYTELCSTDHYYSFGKVNANRFQSSTRDLKLPGFKLTLLSDTINYSHSTQPGEPSTQPELQLSYRYFHTANAATTHLYITVVYLLHWCKRHHLHTTRAMQLSHRQGRFFTARAATMHLLDTQQETGRLHHTEQYKMYSISSTEQWHLF